MHRDQKLAITIWMNMPSFYQIDLFCELAEMKQIDLKVIFARNVPSERSSLGWRTEFRDLKLDVQFLDSAHPILDAIQIAWRQRQRIHIINGIWAEPPFTVALAILRISCPHYFVYSEAPVPYYQRSQIKLMLRKVVAFPLIRTRKASLLAVSRFSKEFYQQYGFTLDRIYDFGYFRKNNTKIVKNNSNINELNTTFIYVGQLSKRKRVDLLIKAVEPILNDKIRLLIIGGGEEYETLIQLARDLSISEFITFYGIVTSDEVLEIISKSDALVLPSSYDGWGLVINEALMVGVPVILSDGCGSAEVVQHGESGFIFANNKMESLRLSIQQFLSSDRELLKEQAMRTGNNLNASVASRYMVECLMHALQPSQAKPIPPWRKASNSHHKK